MGSSPADLILAVASSRDPAGAVARLRESDPVCWVPGLDLWLVTRHEDVRILFADSRVTPDPRVYERYTPPSEGPPARWLAKLPFLADASSREPCGRRLVSAALTPAAIARMEDVVQEVVEQFARPLRGRRGVVDLIPAFATPIPSTVIGRILGVPPKGEDEARFGALARRMVRGINPILEERKRLETERAAVEICEYLLGLVLARRAQPGDDLISDLVRAAGPDADPDDIVRVVAGLVSAGSETVVLAGTRSLRTLLRHPEQLAMLRRDRTLLSGAVNELLRYEVGLVGMPRYVLEDFELRGQRLRRGQLVVLSLMGAHRDPRVFPDPDRLDLRRENKELVAFGHGPHYCLGGNVARAELRLMIDAALDFLPAGARLLEDRVQWGARGVLSRVKSLPVDFGD